MRIISSSLVFLFSVNLFAEVICGTYNVQVFVPEKAQGKEVHANPKAVSSTKITLKTPVDKVYWGRVIDIEVTFKIPCLISCNVDEYKILKTVSPFEKLRTFNHDQSGLVKKIGCERTL